MNLFKLGDQELAREWTGVNAHDIGYLPDELGFLVCCTSALHIVKV